MAWKVFGKKNHQFGSIDVCGLQNKKIIIYLHKINEKFLCYLDDQETWRWLSISSTGGLKSRYQEF